MSKRRATAADQTPLDGMAPPDQANSRKIEGRGQKYVDCLAQWQSWGAARDNAKTKLEEAMDEEGVEKYTLKAGHKLQRTIGDAKIKVKFAKNDEGTVDAVELEEVEVG